MQILMKVAITLMVMGVTTYGLAIFLSLGFDTGNVPRELSIVGGVGLLVAMAGVLLSVVHLVLYIWL